MGCTQRCYLAGKYTFINVGAKIVDPAEIIIVADYNEDEMGNVETTQLEKRK